MKFLYLFLIFLFPKLSYSLEYKEYIEVKKAVQKAFFELRPQSNHNLTINKPVEGIDNFWWNSETVHASYSGLKYENKLDHHVFLFGGFIRQYGMTKDGLAVTACHELGHGIGGEPKKNSGSSTEGQADYYATKKCLPIVFKYLKEQNRPEMPYLIDLCLKYNPTDSLCSRSLHALISNQEFFINHLDVYVDYEVMSQNIATEIIRDDTYYPDAQCRFDTSIHGVLQLKRPRCWFPNGIERKL